MQRQEIDVIAKAIRNAALSKTGRADLVKEINRELMKFNPLHNWRRLNALSGVKDEDV